MDTQDANVYPSMLPWEKIFFIAFSSAKDEYEQTEKDLALKAISSLCVMADVLGIKPQMVAPLGTHDGIDAVLEDMYEETFQNDLRAQYVERDEE